MTERACIRGCTVRDVHFATCEDFGKTTDEGATCKGCAPVVARQRALVCERCYRRIRRHLEDAADVLGHLRSIADPTKAAVYDKVMVSSSRPELPAPVDAKVIDASNDIMRTMREWAMHVDPSLIGRRGLAAGAPADVAWDEANDCAQALLEVFDDLANRKEIADLAEALMHHGGREPEWWSVADALGQWPLTDRPGYAQRPCPNCDLKTVWVIPPRRKGDPARYRCRTCDWEADDRDDDGLWADVFAEPVPERTPLQIAVLASAPAWTPLPSLIPFSPTPLPRSDVEFAHAELCFECFTLRAVNGACAC